MIGATFAQAAEVTASSTNVKLGSVETSVAEQAAKVEQALALAQEG